MPAPPAIAATAPAMQPSSYRHRTRPRPEPWNGRAAIAAIAAARMALRSAASGPGGPFRRFAGLPGTDPGITGSCPEDVIADAAKAAHPIRSLPLRFVGAMGGWVKEDVKEIGAGISAQDFRVKVRAGLNARTWRRHGERLIHECSEHDKPVLLVIDELPMFLKRMLREDGGERRVKEFLSRSSSGRERFN